MRRTRRSRGGLTPNTPGVGSSVHIDVSGTAPELAGSLPESVALSVQRGFALDVRAVAVRCSGTALTSGKCPAKSRIGTGQAVVSTNGLLNQDIPATIDVFLAAPVQSADVASAVVVISAVGLSRAVRTRLLAPATGRFGYELRLEGIATAVPTIPGVSFGLRSLSLDLGARRRATKTTYKRVARHSQRSARHGAAQGQASRDVQPAAQPEDVQRHVGRAADRARRRGRPRARLRRSLRAQLSVTTPHSGPLAGLDRRRNNRPAQEVIARAQEHPR